MKMSSVSQRLKTVRYSVCISTPKQTGFKLQKIVVIVVVNSAGSLGLCVSRVSGSSSASIPQSSMAPCSVECWQQVLGSGTLLCGGWEDWIKDSSPFPFLNSSMGAFKAMMSSCLPLLYSICSHLIQLYFHSVNKSTKPSNPKLI